MCDFNHEHECTSGAEQVRNYYRLQGRAKQKQEIINIISDYCDQEHAWIDRCECWMFIKIIQESN
jgi:hypothetical protein